MSKSDELFKELGYEKFFRPEEVIVYDDGDRQIEFIFKYKEVKIWNIAMDMKELQAINKKNRRIRLGGIKMDLDKDELKATREMFENKVKKMGEIRSKRIAECDRDELIARCCYDEQYIRILEEKLKMKEDIGIEKY